MKISEKIQFQRVRRGLSQDGLAEKLGVTRQSVSKWELGQAMPDVEKVVLLSRLFNMTTDELLLDEPHLFQNASPQMLHWGFYIVVKDFEKSVSFYAKFLSRRASVIIPGKFAEFRFDDRHLMSVMDETHLPNHDTSGAGDYKFALNLWVKDLEQEFQRVNSLNIGRVTEIINPHSNYWFFNLYDPDENTIEITGGYYK